MEKFRLGVSATIAGLLIILILQNMVSVDVRLLWWTITIPRALLLALAVMGGFVIGVLVRMRRT